MADIETPKVRVQRTTPNPDKACLPYARAAVTSGGKRAVAASDGRRQLPANAPR